MRVRCSPLSLWNKVVQQEREEIREKQRGIKEEKEGERKKNRSITHNKIQPLVLEAKRRKGLKIKLNISKK